MLLGAIVIYSKYVRVFPLTDKKCITMTKAALTLDDLYDTTCTIQLVWQGKIANSYKRDIQIFVWYIF